MACLDRGLIDVTRLLTASMPADQAAAAFNLARRRDQRGATDRRQEGVVFLVKRGDALMRTLPADKRASVALYLADELATIGDRLERTANFAFAMHGIDYDPSDAA